MQHHIEGILNDLKICLFNSALNSTASNRRGTENSSTNRQTSEAELAKRKNIRKAKGGIKVYKSHKKQNMSNEFAYMKILSTWD